MDKITRPDEEYFMHCVKCLTRNELTMHPHRRDGLIVGWVFVCLKCEGEVRDKEIQLPF